MTKTSRFSEEFKAAAVRRLAAGESATKVAKDLDTTTTTLWRWKQEGWGDAPTPPAPVPPNGHNGNGHRQPYTPPHVDDVPATEFDNILLGDSNAQLSKRIAELEALIARRDADAGAELASLRGHLARVTAERDALAKLAQVHLAERMS
jgi:transposase-like protein